jgi:hypothetical protein
MKILVQVCVFILMISGGSAFAATDLFKSQFNDFVGHYQIVACSGRVLIGAELKEEADDICDRKYVHLYLGDDYQEKADGDIYFFNVSNSLKEPTTNEEARDFKWIGIDLATDPAAFDEGMHGNSSYGRAMWISNDSSIIDSSSISQHEGVYTLHRNLTEVKDGKITLFYDTVLTLKKVD